MQVKRRIPPWGKGFFRRPPNLKGETFLRRLTSGAFLYDREDRDLLGGGEN